MKVFCDTLVKQCLTTIDRPIGISLHSKCAAELAGCIIGCCGVDLVMELYTVLIPMYVSDVTDSHPGGQILSHLAFYAGVYSGLFAEANTNANQGNLTCTSYKTVAHFFQYLSQLLERDHFFLKPGQSFPLTFLFLATSVPGCMQFFPKLQMLSILYQLRTDQLSLLDLSDPQDRKICIQFFSNLP